MKEAVHMLDLLPPEQRKGFLRLFGQFVQQRQKPVVEWARLEPPPPHVVVQARDIPPCPKDQALRHELLDKMVILKLNGEGAGRVRILTVQAGVRTRLVCDKPWFADPLQYSTPAAYGDPEAVPCSCYVPYRCCMLSSP